MSWTQDETDELIRLSKEGGLFYSEIAQRLGKNAKTVRWKARRLGLDMTRPEGRNGEWNRKHVHLRESAMKYFMTHSAEATAEHFHLTKSEFKSLLYYAYKDPSLARLRKDRRRKDSWTLKETLFLLRCAGIQPRKWIASKLNRGGLHSVKEQLDRLNSRSKFLNGVPRSWLLQILDPKLVPAGIKTKAGPTGCPRRGSDFRFLVVPWTDCARLARRYPKRFPPEMRSIIRAMAKFQRWIHGTGSDAVVTRRIRKILKEENPCEISPEVTLSRKPTRLTPGKS